MGKCVNNFDNSTCRVKQAIASHFADLVSRIGCSNTHVVESKIHQNFTAKRQKLRRVPIILRLRICVKIDRLKKGHKNYLVVLTKI